MNIFYFCLQLILTTEYDRNAVSLKFWGNEFLTHRVISGTPKKLQQMNKWVGHERMIRCCYHICGD